MGQIIKNLVGGAGGSPRDGIKPLHFRNVHIAHAPGLYLTLLLQLNHGGNRIFNGMGTAPVKQKQIHIVRLQPVQAPFAGRFGSCPAGVAGQHLGNQENTVAQSADCRSHHFLVAIHLRRIHYAHAQLNAGAQSIYLIGFPQR